MLHETYHGNESKRIFGLDLFRAIAILLVVMAHGGFIIEVAIPGFPGFSVPDGVELFFVLSGFLIGGILIHLIESNRLENLKDLLQFWKRRWLRTLPTYYLVLIINLFFAWSGLTNAKTENFSWKFLLFIHNFHSPFTDFFWESWSLSIEEWFYIIAPILLLIVAAIFKSRFGAKNAILFVIIVLTALPLFYRLSLSDVKLDAFWFDVTFRKTVVTRLDAIMYGVFVAWLWKYQNHFMNKYKWWFFSTGVLILFFTKSHLSDDSTGFDSMTWGFSAMGLGTSFLLPFAASWENCKWPGAKTITHVSLISYSMYLINLGLVAMVIEKHFMPVNAIQSVVIYITYWIIVVTGSTLLYKHFEKPMTDLRDRF